MIPAGGKGLVKTQLSIAIPRDTYARIGALPSLSKAGLSSTDINILARHIYMSVLTMLPAFSSYKNSPPFWAGAQEAHRRGRGRHWCVCACERVII